jgi:hypothetical protein
VRGPKGKPQVPPLRFAPVGMTKDGVAITWKVVAGHEATTLYQTIALSFVIPTGANPDFLPRSARQGRVCAFL